MPWIKEIKPVPTVVGFSCDLCGSEFEHEPVHIQHYFGYHAPDGLDGTELSATLCEACAQRLLKPALPSRCFKQPDRLG